ncbi:hemerythrin domain-containing protein [Kitasatospora sp. NPDC089913]|uniref:hemerythrin domain-containing protein n=1 Tax=Streptomycetaceae TaxID=2062 RepID=UPI000879A9AF|nr:hemerythrin domain-containing protein [Streptomyces sp. TLI_053]SDT79419.1 Hemerythrin HHE cation binding domain-containing protein [Streptomyces sp. TLI_053]
MSRRPDILGEFTAEHRAVEDLLVRIEAGLAEDRAPGALLDQLTDLLLSHCAAEEEHLFPLVQHDVPDGGAVVFRCIHDHLAIGQYLADLQALPSGDPALGILLSGLTEVLRRHLATEEKQLFTAARKALPAAERAALGERLRAERAEIAGAGP